MKFLCAVLHLAEAPSRWLQGHQPPPSQPPARDHHDRARYHHDRDRYNFDRDRDDHDLYDSNADDTIYTYTHVLLTDCRSKLFRRACHQKLQENLLQMSTLPGGLSLGFSSPHFWFSAAK